MLWKISLPGLGVLRPALDVSPAVLRGVIRFSTFGGKPRFASLAGIGKLGGDWENFEAESEAGAVSNGILRRAQDGAAKKRDGAEIG